MHVSLIFDEEISNNIYSQYCRYVYDEFKKDLKKLVLRKSRNYKVREDYIRELINIKDPIDLSRLVIYSTEMLNVNGVYVIRLNPRKKVHGVKVSTLVRLLEFGALGFPELPVLRRVMFKYQRHYKDYIDEFTMKGVIL